MELPRILTALEKYRQQAIENQHDAFKQPIAWAHYEGIIKGTTKAIDLLKAVK